MALRKRYFSRYSKNSRKLVLFSKKSVFLALIPKTRFFQKGSKLAQNFSQISPIHFLAFLRFFVHFWTKGTKGGI
jgi:hypothetical protein